MKTSKHYMDCINNRTITEEIIEACLYSVNKRAKNHRDRAREAEYRYRYDYYGVGINERMKMEEMYNMKDTMLETLSPVCAHYVERDYKVPSEAPYDCCETYDSYKECFLLYKIGNHTFHTPVDEDDEYYQSFIKSGKVEELHDFTTYGADVSDLISMQFVKKLVRLIEIGNYTYIAA